MATSGMRLVFDKTQIVGKEVRERVAQVVKETAFDIEGRAKTLAPVDTGFMRNSIQTEETGELSARVSVGAEYAPHVEFGTHKQSAQPFLGPAVEEQRERFADEITTAIREAAG